MPGPVRRPPPRSMGVPTPPLNRGAIQSALARQGAGAPATMARPAFKKGGKVSKLKKKGK